MTLCEARRAILGVESKNVSSELEERGKWGYESVVGVLWGKEMGRKGMDVKDVEKSWCVDLLARGSGLEIKVFPNVKYPHAKVLLIYIIRTFTLFNAYFQWFSVYKSPKTLENSGFLKNESKKHWKIENNYWRLLANDVLLVQADSHQRQLAYLHSKM